MRKPTLKSGAPSVTFPSFLRQCLEVQTHVKHTLSSEHVLHKLHSSCQGLRRLYSKQCTSSVNVLGSGHGPGLRAGSGSGASRPTRAGDLPYQRKMPFGIRGGQELEGSQGIGLVLNYSQAG